MTYEKAVNVLVDAGLLAKADAQWAEADDDPEGFDEDLAGAGIL